MKFDVIYADPPWAYKVYSKKGEGRSAENHYHTMTIDDICALDVGSIAEKNCVLLLWVTFPCLVEGLRVIKEWGFTYKTLGFCWAKRNKKQTDTWFWGLGFWTRSNPELCLIATRGSPKREHKGIHSIVDTPIEKHSRKPDEVRKRIELLLGEKKRVELFAREQHEGWTCVGNEIDGLDIVEALKELAEQEELEDVNEKIEQ